MGQLSRGKDEQEACNMPEMADEIVGVKFIRMRLHKYEFPFVES